MDRDTNYAPGRTPAPSRVMQAVRYRLRVGSVRTHRSGFAVLGEDPMKMTRRQVMKGQSREGGWSREQLELVGVP